jgi:hypothetical protein
MTSIADKIKHAGWPTITEEMHKTDILSFPDYYLTMNVIR